jgi:hypothetical protein
MKYEIEWYKAKTDRDYKETIAKTQEDRTKIEV